PRARPPPPPRPAPPPIDDLGAPIGPPRPHRAARPGEAVARLSSPHLRRSMTWGPRYGPQAPNVRPAPAKPWRASHHRTSAITRVAPICSIAPHNPPYVVRVSPRSFGARSSAPTTRSIAGSVIGPWLLPTFTSPSTPGKP